MPDWNDLWGPTGTGAYSQQLGLLTTQTVTITWSANTTAATWIGLNGYWPQQVNSNAYGYGGYGAESSQQQLRRRAQANREWEEFKRASERARELLYELLDEEQQAEFESKRYFHVETADGRRRYRIVKGNGVREVKDDRVTSYLCIHPEKYLPDEDVMVAQKLMIETDEEAFLEIANATPAAC